jgi:cytochrome b561
MYFCLAMIPLTGLGIGGLYWSGIQAGDWMAGLLLAHEIFANTVLFLICAHIAAAFYHRKCRDGVWNSMVPFLREPRGINAPAESSVDGIKDAQSRMVD